MTAQSPIEAPDLAAFDRSLMGARLAVDSHITVAVDGIGRWHDDGQLDAVIGETTNAPTLLTTGLSYPPRDPLAHVEALDRFAGAPPPDLGESPPLMILSPHEHPSVIRRLDFDATGIHLQVRDGASLDLEILAESRPFLVPANRVLTYQRPHAQAYFELVFEDGRRLGRPPEAVRDVVVDLTDFATLRVEAIVLVYTPRPDGALGVSLKAPRLHAP